MAPHVHIGPLVLPSYSLMVFLGAVFFVVVTIFVFEKLCKLQKEITNRILILSVFGFAALGASAFIFNSFFHSIEEGRLVLGGITWLGGVLGGFPIMILLIHKLSPMTRGEALATFDLLVPGITLAHGLGRVGCFLAGCCYGGVTDGPLGVVFPAGSSAAATYPGADGASLPVLPTQLFEAVFDILLFIVMMSLFKWLRGHLLETYAFAYGVFRFSLEFLRGDDRGATGIAVTPSQLMSVVLIALGVLVLLYKRGIIMKKLAERMRSLREEREKNGPPLTLRSTKLLRELKQLCDEGVITSEEFEEKKAELLQLKKD